MSYVRQNKDNDGCAVESTSKAKAAAGLFSDQRESALVQLQQQQLMAAAPLQRMAVGEEDEELLQGKFVAQREEMEDEQDLLQRKFEPAQRAEKPNNTGLPDNLKSGIENLSGMSMDHVKVHYNSDKPAQLQAHAYAQGSDIHIAPGQEQHLPHEAWHVVQQMQGRVRPTAQMQGGVGVNDEVGLEREADSLGAQALLEGTARTTVTCPSMHIATVDPLVQRTILGTSYEHWAKNVKRVSGKKLDELKRFLEVVHAIDNIDFSINEIDGFYDEKLSKLSHSEMAEDQAGKLTALKRYAALVRDDEGGHGAEKHGEPGDIFLVDRVNSTPGNRAFTASSLDIDNFLQWDILLNRESAEIYEKYVPLARSRLDEIKTSVVNEGAIEGLDDIRSRVGRLEGKEWENYVTRSAIVPRLTLSTEIRANAISMEESKRRPIYTVPINAEVQGLAELAGRSASRARGVGRYGPAPVISGEDVVSIKKRPEAYTGALSPKYNILSNGEQTGTPDKTKLEWVTKF